MHELDNAGELRSFERQLPLPCALRIHLKHDTTQITPSTFLVKQAHISCFHSLQRLMPLNTGVILVKGAYVLSKPRIPPLARLPSRVQAGNGLCDLALALHDLHGQT